VKKRRFLLRWFNRLLLLATIICGLASLIPSDLFSGSGLFALIFPTLIVPHILFFILNLRVSLRNVIPHLIGIGLTFLPAMAQLPIAKTIDAPEKSIRIASYNVRAFYQSENASSKIAAWAQRQEIDVLCMQEIRKPEERPVRQLYSNVFFAPKWSGYCVGIFSKYPIVYEELLEFKELPGDGYPKYSAGFADIVLPWDTVRFINVHLSSTGVSDGDMSVEPNADDFLARTKDIVGKIIQSERARGLQAKSILKWVDQSPHPTVLCGDFNGVPSGNLYARLLQKMKDPYICNGTGKMGSFEPLKRRFLPIRIDWTLLSKGIKCTDQHLEHIDFSDHYPLVTTINAPILE
jgi:endonuclease/exonuclease/phosphatase (EEP) superfamily protein YafD